MTLSRRSFAPLMSFGAALGMMALAGCEAHRPPDNLAQAVQMGERPVAMTGTDTFFGGTVEVTATISRGIGKGLKAPKHHFGDGASRGGPEVADVGSMESDEAQAYMRSKMAVGSPLPPVTLHLILHNTSKETFSVTIIDFDSDLGNFAVHPDVLSIAPDQSAEPDSMVSQLGVGSDLIPVKVTLMKGGVRETKLVQVKALEISPTSPPSK